MSRWTKYFKPVNSVLPSNSAIAPPGNSVTSSKFNSFLPEVYQGPANRLQRYAQYDQMDMDHDVNSALDTMAEFSTMEDEHDLPFDIHYREMPSETERNILQSTLRKWCEINEMTKRIFRIFRSTLKYGDQIFIRDPETFKLIWIDPQTVERVIVNESQGKKPEVYYIKNLDLNLQTLTGTDVTKKTAGGYGSSDSVFPNAPLTGQANYTHGHAATSQVAMGSYTGSDISFPVDAIHVVHISLTEGMDDAWPFGVSVLEKVFKVYKQKELLEDSIIIYRVHRAPERRVFFIDVGTMPPQKAQQYLERVRYEVQQKRIPSRTGGGQNIMDAAYNPLCLDLATKIPLLDGRVLKLEELIEEYQAGKENWVYSCDPITGKPLPGNITWAGITRQDAECIKITLDNGESLICTPDHKIPVLGKGFVEAQNLTENDPLVSFETRRTSLSRDPARTYEEVYDHSSNSWRFTHRVVAEFFKNIGKHQVLHFDESLVDTDKDTVHHKDYNLYNNDPRNLVWMNSVDHVLYHSFNKKEYWDSISGVCAQRLKANKAQNQTFYPSRDFLTRLVEIVKENNSNRLETLRLGSRDKKLISIMVRDNPFDPKSTHNLDNTKLTDKKLKKVYEMYGFNGWKDFKEKVNYYNHRVVSIEKVSSRTVGTITVDGKERWHAHHTFAIQSGIYIKNSMLEDYFFAQSADGRGSKVDTLQGGENLGEIDDLKYWNNKMFRALGIPSSYLPSGPEDGNAQKNDGQLGSFVQEFRFNNTLKRLQRHIVEPLDREFKIFMKESGVNIDSSLFELRFNPPQNFSEYRQIELNAAHANVFSQLQESPYLSRRFLLKKYLGLSEDEILENEKYWKEEQGDLDNMEQPGEEDQLRGAGITPSGFDNFEGEDLPDEVEDIDNMLDDSVSDEEADDFGV